MKEYLLNIIEPVRTSIRIDSDCANNAIIRARVLMYYHHFADAILVCRIDGRDNTICRFKIDKIDNIPSPDSYVKNHCSKCPYRNL